MAPATTWAQQDTSRHAVGEQPLLSTTVRESLQKLRAPDGDTLLPVKKSRLDSLNAALSTTTDLWKKNNPAKRKADSLRSILNIQDTVSLRLNTYQQKVRSLEDSVERRITFGNKISDTNNTLQQKADSLSQKINKPMQEAQKKIEKKLNEVTHGDAPQIPGADKLNVPQNTGTLPFSTPDVSVPGQLDINNVLPQKDLPALPSMDVKDKLPEVKIPEVKMPQMDQVKDVSKSLESVDGKLSEAEKVEGELRKVKEEGPDLQALPDKAEDELRNVEQVKAAEGEIGKATGEQEKYQALIKQYKDQKVLKQEMERKTRMVANDYLAANAGKFEAAQQKIAQARAEANKIKSVRDIFKRRSDEFEGKKNYRRMVPGITWQLYNKTFVSAEFGLQLGYRVSPRLTLGAGYVHRWGFSESFANFVKDLNTYGGRAYADMALVKGIFVHGEFEAMHVEAFQPGATETDINPVLGSYFGVGKRFKIAHNFRGSITGVFRVNYKAELPDVNKLNLRFGVDYVFRLKRRKL
jgi:hypothetical protein